MPTVDDPFTTVEPMLRSLMAQERVAAVALVAAPGTPPLVTWVPGGGEEPRFLAYSITKSFIAILVLGLREAGRLDLEDSLDRWCPSVPRARHITLRQLLAHTSGLPDYGGRRVYHDAVRRSPSTAWSFERFAAETYEAGLAFEPGTGWGYSNVGYMLLKRILEEVAGVPFAQLVDDRVARPLGLERTSVAATASDLVDLAPARSASIANDGVPIDVRGRYHPGWVSHGVVASTASEIARCYDALFAGRLLPPAAVAEMQVLVPIDSPAPAPWREPSYGLGLMGDPASPFGRVVGHEGGGPGYTAGAFHRPAPRGVTVCAMATEGDGASARDLVFALLGESPEGARRTA